MHALRRVSLLFFILLAVAALTLVPARADTPSPTPEMYPADQDFTFRVGLYENAPKIYTNEDGNAAGFWPDLLRYIADKEGWEIEWVAGSWNEGLERLEGGEIDIMLDVAWTESRSKRFDFSQETVLLSWSRLYTQKGTDIQSIFDLEGKTIAALADSFNLEGPGGIRELTREFEIDCTLLAMEDYGHIFEALNRGEIDAGVTNKDFGNLYEEEYNIERTPIIFQPARLLFALTKDAERTPYLIKRIDVHMHDLKAENTSIYYQTLEEHIGGKVAETFIKTIPGWIKNVLLASAGLIVFLLAVAGVSRVQTSRKTAQLRASEKKYRGLFEQNNDAIFILDLQGNHLDANQRTSELLGYSPEELNTLSFRDISGQVEQSEKVLERLLRGEHIPFYKRIFLKKDGEPIDVEVNVALVHDTHGNPLHIQSVIRDITERVHAQKELEQSKHFLDNVLESIQDGISVLDTELNVEHVNNLMKEWYAENTPLEGKKCYQCYHNSDEPCHPCPSLRCLESGETEMDIIPGLPGSEVEHIELYSYPIKDPRTGKVSGVVEFVRDITERVQAEKALEQYAQQLKTLNTINTALSSTLTLDDVLNLILVEIQTIIPIDSAAIFLIEEDKLHVMIDQGITPSIAGHTFPDESQLFQEIRATQEPLVLNHAQEDPRFKNWGYTEKIQSWLGVPLYVSGKLLGYLTLDNNQPEVYDTADVELAQSFAVQAAQAINNARLHKAIQEHANRLEIRVHERTAKLKEKMDEQRRIMNLMAGREVRMAELKKVIKRLRAQLEEAGMEPVADDPLAMGME